MSYSAIIKYDKALVRRALNRYMVRRLGISFFLVTIALAVILLLSFVFGLWNWWFTLIAIVLLAAIAFILFVYFARLRASEGFFDKANEPTVTFKFTANGIQTISDLGTTDLKWQVFDEILKFPDLWLLVYAKSGYMTLPVDQLTTECMQFIDNQISENTKAKI
jgi:hypothetical protein